MKKIWNFLVTLADSLSKARAASTMVRLGRSDLAKDIISKK